MFAGHGAEHIVAWRGRSPTGGSANGAGELEFVEPVDADAELRSVQVERLRVGRRRQRSDIDQTKRNGKDEPCRDAWEC